MPVANRKYTYNERTSRTLSELEQRTLFNLIPRLREVAFEKGEIRALDANVTICRKGEKLDHLVIPISEHLVLFDSADVAERKKTHLGYLQKKRALALASVLDDAPVPYSAITEASTTVFLLPQEDLILCLKALPNVLHYLQLMLHSSGARGLKRLLEEREVEQETVFELFSHLEMEEFFLAPKESLEMGGKYLFLVDRGRLAVKKIGTGPAGLVCEVGEGAWFGGEALVPPNATSYEVEAIEKTIYRRADLESIREYLADLNLIEFFFDEPWLVPTNEPEVSDNSASATVAKILPGDAVPRRDLDRFGWRVDVNRVSSGKNIFNSLADSLGNLCLFLGVPINLPSVRAEMRLVKVLSPLQIAQLCERFGLIVANVKCEYRKLHRQRLPGLVMYGDRYSVLLRADKRQVYLLDPCQGFLRVDTNTFCQEWDGFLIDVTIAHTDSMMRNERNQKSEKGEEEAAYGPDSDLHLNREARTKPFSRPLFATFSRYLLELLSLPLNRFGIALIGLALGVVLPKMTEFMIDEALGLRRIDAVWVIVIGIVLMKGYECVVALIDGLIQADFSAKLEHRVGVLFFRQALAAYSMQGTKSVVGNAQARFGELGTVRSFFSDSAISILMAVVSASIYSVVLFFYNWKLTLLALSVLPATVILRLLYRKRLTENFEDSFRQTRRMSELSSDQINAIAGIKASGAEQVMKEKWEQVFVDGVKLRRRLGLEVGGIEGVMGFVVSVIQVGLLYCTFKMAADGEITAGAVFAIQAYSGEIIGPVQLLASLFSQVEELRVAQSKVADVFQMPVEDSPSRANVTYSMPLRGKIRLERVNFRYENGPWVLKDLEVVIYPNQIVAVVGRSGCGKTTLARLISGIAQPTTGRIYFDNIDQNMLSKQSLRQQIGIILQNNELFRGTISENIAYGDDVPDQVAIERAARLASADGFIGELPGNYSYFISEGGMGISGGQKQRVAIARVLYREPKVLVMDEATSALDSESEVAIMTNMRLILRNRTALIIAHRLSTIRFADRILVMRAGEIVEDGTHQTLMQQRGHYFELFRDQIATMQEVGGVV